MPSLTPVDFFSRTPEQMADAVSEAVAAQKQLVQSGLEQSAPTFASFLWPLEQADHATGLAWAPLAQLAKSCDTPQVRVAHDRAQQVLTEFGTWMMDQDGMHVALCHVRDTDTLDPWQAALVRDGIRAYERRGVGLSDTVKNRLAAIKKQVSLLGTTFGRNVQDTVDGWHMELTAEQVQSMPTAARRVVEQAGREKGVASGYAVTLQAPVMTAVMVHCPDREVRRMVQAAQDTRCTLGGVGGADKSNVPIILSLLALRHERAALAGHSDYAHMALEDNMATTPDMAVGLLHRLRESARTAAEREWDALATYAQAHCGIDDMKHYDAAFVAERQKQDLFGLSDDAVRQYFPHTAVVAGMLAVSEKLFGVRFEQDERVKGWHQDVSFYRVLEGDKVISGFYLDPFARTGKRGGAWMSALVSGLGNDVCPIASLNCNSAPGAEGAHALMTHQEVVTLFHEFGHGLHLMLGQSPYSGVAMTGVERDAIEGPSQLMENFAWDRDTLKSFARHVGTGVVIPDIMLDQLQAAKRHNGALAVVRQLVFGLTDLALHRGEPVRSEEELWGLQDAIRSETAVAGATPVGGDKILASFTHIFAGGYASAYYSYLWAEVLSADSFAAFNPAQPVDPVVGRRYRKEILAVGAQRPSLDSFVAFRGRTPDPEALMVARGMTDAVRRVGLGR